MFVAREDGVELFLEEIAAHEGEVKDVAPFLGVRAFDRDFEEGSGLVDFVCVGEPEAGHGGTARGEIFVGRGVFA